MLDLKLGKIIAASLLEKVHLTKKETRQKHPARPAYKTLQLNPSTLEGCYSWLTHNLVYKL